MTNPMTDAPVFLLCFSNTKASPFISTGKVSVPRYDNITSNEVKVCQGMREYALGGACVKHSRLFVAVRCACYW